MTVEVLLLALACGLTLLAYMIAINAHGPTRLSLSYLIATIMLAGTVWGVVQYVNTDIDAKKMEELRRLEMEKQRAEERVLSQEEALRANKERMSFATKLNAVITSGTGYASSMMNMDLQDKSLDLEALMAKASDIKKKTDELKSEYEKVTANGITHFNESSAVIKEAIQSLAEAAYYFRAYYYSEDPEQEKLRERLLRQKARFAYDKFQNASALIASSGS